MRKTLSLSLLTALVLMTGFMFLEPQSVQSAEDSVDVSLTVTSEITISSPSNVDMGSMTGITSDTATGECTWTVVTTENAGFTMTLKESDAAPALSGQSEGDSFADYTEESAGDPDYEWTLADSTSEFGFTVEPETDADASAIFLDNGSDACNTGSNQTEDKCWFGFDGTSAITVINRSSETDYSGEDEVVKFKAGVYNADGVPNDANGIVTEDTYQATITATVTAN